MLSQWFPASFEVDGDKYNCAEQYMMAEKARVFHDLETWGKIMFSSSPKEIKALGREVRNFDAEQWLTVSKDIVVICHTMAIFCRDFGYPAQDVLQLNDIWNEVHVRYQHFATQDPNYKYPR